ncbi:putative membrane protein [Escherichia phage mistaenkt]|uniref:Putative membrane protein n=1 Tax=Escherichia phage mistaenkt TaxID=2696420 RepID=A0A6B9WVK9_9CAUD|nr:putative membrane protein [Escherichia phage mistaenkt]
MKEMTGQGKEIFSLLKSGNGFSNPLITGAAVLGGTVAASTSLVSSISSVSDPTVKDKLIAAGLTTALLSSFSTSLGSTTTTTNTLTQYGQKSVDEFSSRMQVAKGYSNVMGAAGEQVGCTPFSGIMGVATEYGQQAMDLINTSIDTVNGVLSDLQDAINKGLDTISSLASQAVTAINQGIAKITAYANEVTQMIADEAALIADYLKTNINGFLAGILPDWFDDACKTGVIDSIATPEMKDALNK